VLYYARPCTTAQQTAKASRESDIVHSLCRCQGYSTCLLGFSRLMPISVEDFESLNFTTIVLATDRCKLFAIMMIFWNMCAAHHAAFDVPAAFRVDDGHQLPEGGLVAPAQRPEGFVRHGRDLPVSAHRHEPRPDASMRQ